MQCHALTLKGLPCKLKPRPGQQYCDVHLKSTSKAPQSFGPEKHGYIYAYTVTHKNVHIYDHRRQQFVPLASTTPKKPHTGGCFPCFSMSSKSKSSPQPSQTSQTGILVKVGYTTKTPEARLKEWTNKCQQHTYKLLEPRSTLKYDTKAKGWPSPTPKAHEAAILAKLRNQFGYGHVECHGCGSKHVEWFKVSDSSQLAKLYDTIRSTI